MTNHLDEVAEVIWTEGWPWWVRAFVGTLEGNVRLVNGTSTQSEGLMAGLAYSPPIARERATHLQARLVLPPRSTATVLIKYESSFLWYTEYPSDAHRGFELPPAALRLLPGPGGVRAGLTIHTASALLSLPTPDFSMPYNVIVLTSTVMALFFGNVMNKLVREWKVVRLEEGDEEVEAGEGSRGSRDVGGR